VLRRENQLILSTTSGCQKSRFRPRGELACAARTFQNIKAPKDASFFLHNKRQATDPDHDGDGQ